MTEWVTKDVARELTGMSESTLERRVKEGALRRDYQARPGRKSEPVYAREDLDGLKKSKTPIVLKTEPRKPLWDVNEKLPVISPSQQITKSPFQQTIIPSVPLDKKLFLTMPEAVAYSGLPRSFLFEKAKTGTLRFLKAGRYFVSRHDLEEMTVWGNDNIVSNDNIITSEEMAR